MLYADNTALLEANKDPNILKTDFLTSMNKEEWKGRRRMELGGLPKITLSTSAKYLEITIHDRLSC